jgi:hypothetical protein
MNPSVLRTAARIVELFRKHLPDLPTVDEVAKLIDEGTRHSRIVEAFEEQTSRMKDMARESATILERARGPRH